MTQPSRSSPRLIALIVACAMFMAQLDGAVVTLVLPDMARSFATTAIGASTGVTVYLLIQVILMPASGWLADRFGVRRVFTLAIVGFTVASVLCGLSRSLPQFVAARVLQGCAAALMTPVGRILLLHSTAKEDLVRVMTISTVPMLLAPSLGPLLGGYISTYYSWPWIFLLNAPIGIGGVALTMRFIPPGEPMPRRPFDTLGFFLFGSAFTLTVEALELLSSESRHGFAPALLLALGCVTGAAAVKHLRRHPHPIISLSAIQIPTFVIATLSGGGVIRVPLRAMSFLLPLMFRLAMGLTAIQSGLLLMAMSGSDLVLKSMATRTLRKFGFRSVLILTASLSVVALVLCSLFSPATPIAWVVAVLLAGGTIRSLLFTGMSSLALADVPRQELSSSSVLWNVMLQATNGLGVSVSVIVLNLCAMLSGEAAGLPTLHDFHVTFITMASISLLSIPSFLKLPRNAGAELSGHGTVTRAKT